ncbi:MAG: 2-hydroxychromene-2-carboxylate isomerase [Deltaproteobacteria bacterium]|nr:MAG: 2-hydroxychromene-2-carboxylate isomerase [Deltaproteobacteria bacterium]
MTTLEFFFDLGSPYSYLAAQRLRHGVEGIEVAWRPFLLGAVFKATGNTMPAANPAKARYMYVDLHRQARQHGIPFTFPTKFPLNTLLPQRLLTGLPVRDIPHVSLALFEAYWVQDVDIASPERLTSVLNRTAVSRANEQDVKDRLRVTTEEAVARGAFGAPTFFVGSEMYFGHDRLEQAIAAARRG